MRYTNDALDMLSGRHTCSYLEDESDAFLDCPLSKTHRRFKCEDCGYIRDVKILGVTHEIHHQQ